MRREGMEVAVGKPKVIYKEMDGKTHEPIEFLVVEVPSEHASSVMRLVLERMGECEKMEKPRVHHAHRILHTRPGR